MNIYSEYVYANIKVLDMNILCLILTLMGRLGKLACPRVNGDQKIDVLILKPTFHWKWGSRWLPNANEIYTQTMKCTWSMQEICVWDSTQPIFH